MFLNTDVIGVTLLNKDSSWKTFYRSKGQCGLVYQVLVKIQVEPSGLKWNKIWWMTAFHLEVHQAFQLILVIPSLTELFQWLWHLGTPPETF